MALQRGDVVLVPFPFSDLSTTKIRPAVVISTSLYHTTQPDLILAATTSKIATADGPLDCTLQNWKAAGLRYPSAIKPVLFTLDPTRVIHHLGALSTADVTEMEKRLRLAIGL